MLQSTSWLQRVARGELSRPLRTALLCATILAAIVTIYFNAVYPVARLSALAFFYLIAINALVGVRWGVASALVLAVSFSLAEYALGPPELRTIALANTGARIVTFLLVIGLVEVIRLQTNALYERHLRRSRLELRQMRAELAQADERFRSVGESIPFGVWQCDASGQVTYMSDSFLQMLGMTLEEVRDGGWLDRALPEDGERIRQAWRNRANWPEIWEDEYRIVGADNRTYSILCRGRCVKSEHDQVLGWTGFNLDLTDRSRAREQLRFLEEAGRLLSMSLDPTTTLERVANLTVPRVADWCAVETLDENGELQSVAVMHSNPAKLSLVRELRNYPRDLSESSGIQKVLRTGEPQLYESVSDDILRRVAKDERHLALLRELGLVSGMVVPLRARGHVLGVMTLAQAESGRRFTNEDLRLAEILAARAALAYDNARIYAKEQRVADTFQRASLPVSLPRIPGIRLHATYLPGGNESEVGGDWYDAFQMPDGRLAVSIGDVAGKGLRAAVAMASIRPSLRGSALEGLSPAKVLEKVNQRVTYEGAGMVTALFGVLDPVTLEFTMAAAGHPLPLLAYPDGRVQKIVAKGLPLGLFGDHQYEEVTLTLEPGNLLVFYTDGLIEFDHNIIEGEERLARAVAAEVETETPDPSAAITRRIIVDPPKDDVALLTILIASQSLDHVDLVTSSVPTSARVIRQALRRFALSTGLDNVRTSDFLTASGEAISNVIEHAYGIDQGTLHVRAFREDGDIVVKVMDRGAWRDGRRQGSGRGLPIMRALMKEVEIERSGQGTTVSMRMPLTEQASDDPSNVSALTS